MHPPRTANTLAKQCRATLKPKVTGDCYHKHRLFYNVDFKHYSNYQGDESSDEHHRGRTRVQPACPDCCHWLWPRSEERRVGRECTYLRWGRREDKTSQRI